MIGRTRDSLALPQLDAWSNTAGPSWWKPVARARLAVARQDPGREGLATLRVIEAETAAAATRHAVKVA